MLIFSNLGVKQTDSEGFFFDVEFEQVKTSFQLIISTESKRRSAFFFFFWTGSYAVDSAMRSISNKNFLTIVKFKKNFTSKSIESQQRGFFFLKTNFDQNEKPKEIRWDRAKTKVIFRVLSELNREADEKKLQDNDKQWE